MKSPGGKELYIVDYYRIRIRVKIRAIALYMTEVRH